MNSYVTDITTSPALPVPSNVAIPSSHSCNDEHTWNEIRFTEMSGFDYIYIPEEDLDKVENAEKAQSFLSGIPALSHNDYSRCIIVGYENDGLVGSVISRINCECVGGTIISVESHPLTNSPQLEFLQTLFDHSEFYFY